MTGPLAGFLKIGVVIGGCLLAYLRRQSWAFKQGLATTVAQITHIYRQSSLEALLYNVEFKPKGGQMVEILGNF